MTEPQGWLQQDFGPGNNPVSFYEHAYSVLLAERCTPILIEASVTRLTENLLLISGGEASVSEFVFSRSGWATGELREICVGMGRETIYCKCSDLLL